MNKYSFITNIHKKYSFKEDASLVYLALFIPLFSFFPLLSACVLVCPRLSSYVLVCHERASDFFPSVVAVEQIGTITIPQRIINAIIKWLFKLTSSVMNMIDATCSFSSLPICLSVCLSVVSVSLFVSLFVCVFVCRSVMMICRVGRSYCLAVTHQHYSDNDGFWCPCPHYLFI